jgi:cytochrome c5
MKKTLIAAAGLFFSTLALSAGNDGNTVYEANCKACHMLKPMMDKQKMMKMSLEERMSMKKKMMKTMKAPPMAKVSAKLKHDFGDDKEKVVAFVKDYIVNPGAQKAHCMPMALKKFGTMPAIGKGMKAEDIETVANWVFDNFSEKWDENAMNMMCNAGKGKGMSMGKGMMKCGGSMAPKPKAGGGMKCAAGKCGGK